MRVQTDIFSREMNDWCSLNDLKDNHYGVGVQPVTLEVEGSIPVLGTRRERELALSFFLYLHLNFSYVKRYY